MCGSGTYIHTERERWTCRVRQRVREPQITCAGTGAAHTCRNVQEQAHGIYAHVQVQVHGMRTGTGTNTGTGHRCRLNKAASMHALSLIHI